MPTMQHMGIIISRCDVAVLDRLVQNPRKPLGSRPLSLKCTQASNERNGLMAHFTEQRVQG